MKPIRIPSIVILLTLIAMIGGCASSGKLSSQDKKRAKAARDLGEAYIMEQRYSAALTELYKAIKINPDDPVTYNNIGLAHMAKGKFEVAVVNFEKAVSLKPEYSLARNNLGSAYLMLNQWDKAIDQLELVTNDVLYGTPHYPLANLGWAYYNKKDYRNARRYLNEALQLQPEFFIARLNMARTAIATGRLHEARRILEKAAPDFPKNPALLFELGRTYRLLGNYRNARMALKGAIRFSETDELAAQAAQELKKLQ